MRVCGTVSVQVCVRAQSLHRTSHKNRDSESAKNGRVFPHFVGERARGGASETEGGRERERQSEVQPEMELFLHFVVTHAHKIVYEVIGADVGGPVLTWIGGWGGTGAGERVSERTSETEGDYNRLEMKRP